MSDDVAAMLAENIAVWLRVHADENWTAEQEPVRSLAMGLLFELADAGYAVVAVPEGVAVAHGARLVATTHSHLWSIEATP